MNKKGETKVKYTVIAGYIIVYLIMAIGLAALYKNLVDFSEKKVSNKDLSELLIVGNTLAQLYEVESEQNLLTAESAYQYYVSYDSIIPVIKLNLDELKKISQDSLRILKLDSILYLMRNKGSNLRKVAVLLDSVEKDPRIIRETESSYVPKELNREITKYLNSKDLSGAQSDTSIVAGNRKGFFDRIKNVFVANPDSVIIIENRLLAAENNFKLIVDTIVNKVRYSERLDLKRQKEFQNALYHKQDTMNITNRLLTLRIDELLKEIEQEEMDKSMQLIIDREKALSRSQNTIYVISVLAILVSLVFAVLFVFDINKSQKYRKQLESSNKRITDLLASREKMMLTISHDLKAPLSSVMGFIELIKECEISDESEASIINDYLSNMEISSEHIMQLVTSLLDFHKLDSGNWEFNESQFNVHKLIYETSSSFSPLAKQKGLNFNIENNIPEDFKCYGDSYVLRQIMSNLISNAIKYTFKGDITIDAKLEIVDKNSNSSSNKRKPEKILVFSVADTGIGIDKNDSEVIFEEFKQLKSGNKEYGSVGGTGLGLAITKSFVEKLEGDIQLKSEKGVGSQFVVRLALYTDPLETIYSNDNFQTRISKYSNIINRELNSVQLEELKGLSILVVDDDPVQLKMISEAIVRKNMHCTTESNPDKVLHLINNNIFELILIDLHLGSTTGYDLIDIINENGGKQNKYLPKIALSASSDLSLQKIKDSGFTNFLIKPFKTMQLYSLIYYCVREEVNSDDLNFNFSNIIPEASKVKGVFNLIDFIKEDPIASTQILQSFIDEAESSYADLEVAMVKDDYITAANLAHKLLPLFILIGEKRVVTVLRNLEKSKSVNENEKEYLLKKIKQNIDEAFILKNNLSKLGDDQR